MDGLLHSSVADPGFPIGGVDLVGGGGGGVDSRGSYVSKILYVKMKESGPLGGVRHARPLDPPMLLIPNAFPGTIARTGALFVAVVPFWHMIHLPFLS